MITVTRKIWSRAVLKILFVSFVLLVVISIPVGVRAYSTPVEEQSTTVLSDYQHKGEYGYTAYLKPNQFYDNKLTLRPGEGTLYTNLVENLDITFTYTFISTQTSDIMIEYIITTELEAPDKWVKSFPTGLENTVIFTGRVVQFSAELSVDIGWVENIIDNLERETGASSSTYNFKIKPTINLLSENSVGTINESFIPALVLGFTFGSADGDQITIDGLENSASGSITENRTIFYPEVSNERGIFTAISAIGLIGLLSTGLLFIKTKPQAPEKLIEQLISPFEGAIVGSGTEPPREGVAVVGMKSLQDLVYVGEGLGKPVLHFEKPGEKGVHIFYVLDGPTRYEYIFELHKKSGRK